MTNIVIEANIARDFEVIAIVQAVQTCMNINQ